MSEHTIGTLAREAGVNVETLRYYEREGLLSPDARSDRGWRRYGSDALSRIRFIKGAQRLGFSLGEIRALLERDGDATSLCAASRAAGERKLAEVEQQIHELEAVRDILREALSRCEADTPVEDCQANRTLRGESE